MRARLHNIVIGPPITAIRRWPSSRRCRVAESPPAQLVAPTVATSGSGNSAAGSISTYGIWALSRTRRSIGVSSDVTTIAPDRPAVASPLDHDREPRRSAIDDTTTSAELDVTPRRISTENGLSMAVKTRSINRRPSNGGRTIARPGGAYLYSTNNCCTRARVSAETSERSLSTLDTVARDTPAAVATVSKVGRLALVTV